LARIARLGLANSVFKKQAGYSSVGRASDCRTSQRSHAPWFDSGWPDIFCAVLAQAEPSVSLLQSYSGWVLGNTQLYLTAFRNTMDTLGIEPRASRMLRGCDTTTPYAPCSSSHKFGLALRGQTYMFENEAPCVVAVPINPRVRDSVKRCTWPGSNWRPSVCGADIIATRP
jgi:hypothetical protein